MGQVIKRASAYPKQLNKISYRKILEISLNFEKIWFIKKKLPYICKVWEGKTSVIFTFTYLCSYLFLKLIIWAIMIF